MRLPLAPILAALVSGAVFGQTYTIQTFAGGGLPENIPGPSASLSRVTWVAVDRAGNVFMTLPDHHVVLRLDTAGLLTRVAGNGMAGYSGDNGPATSARLLDPGPLAVDSAGKLYLADGNRVRLVANGIITTVAGGGTASPGDNGPAGSARLGGPAGLALDAAGNLYIADLDCIRKVSNGVITTVVGTTERGYNGDRVPAAVAQLNNPHGIAVDAAGILYIADTGNGRVREVADGVLITVTNVLAQPQAVAVDASGRLFISDGNSGRILQIANGLPTWVAGSGQQVYNGDNVPAGNAGLSLPQGIALDAAGNLYIADSGNFRVRKVSNGVITTVAGGGGAGDNGPATDAWLYYPTGLGLDASGSLYIADTDHYRIRKVSEGIMTTVAGRGALGCGGNSVPADSVQLGLRPQFAPFGVLQGVAADSSGGLFLADSTCNRVWGIAGGTATIAAGDGKSGFGGDNAPAVSARLSGPEGIAVDAAGNLYIADSGNGRVRKVSGGVITTVAGGGSAAGDDIPAADAQLKSPSGVALDSAGNLYVADTGGHRVRRISNGVVTTVAGGGAGCDNCPATEAFLNGAEGIAVDRSGALYVAESQSHVVRKVSGGVITTVAGNGTPGFGGDGGPAGAAQLWYPHGIAVDASGAVYVADTYNNRVRVLVPSGTACTYAATPAALTAAASGGDVTAAVETGSGCEWAVQSLPDWIAVSGSGTGSGAATVTLAVAANPGAPRTASVSIAGIPVSVSQQGTLAINPGGVVSAASYAESVPLALGSIAAAFGSFLLTQPSRNTDLPLATSLAGLSLEFGNGMKAPLFYAGDGQVNFQVPWELAGLLQTTVTAKLNGQASVAQTINLAPYAPGIFSMNSQGTGQGAILDSSYRLVDASNRATRGSSVVLIFCTGLGPVNNQPPAGSAASESLLATTTTTPVVTIGGAVAPVKFSGLAPGYVGLYQVNAQVPAESAAGDAVPVALSIGGAASNTVTIAVR
jgi:uncharacterized protein (TIGR03437 family)